MIFGFVNPALQDQLIRILAATPINFSHSIPGTIQVTGHYEEAFDAAIDMVRQMKFPFWHSFRALNPAKYDDYISFMKAKNIDFEEEIHGDSTETRWILTEVGVRQYDWGIEEFNQP